MKVAVMGAGGTGGYFGGLLANVGHDVTFIARGAHLESIRQKGLAVKSVLVDDFHVSAHATNDPTEIGPVDLVLFSVKMYDAPSAAQQIKSLVGPETLVISTLNGVDSEEILADAVGTEHVLGCTVEVSAVIAEPGVIDQRGGPGALTIGELPGGKSERTERLFDQLQVPGIAARLVEHMQAVIWQKFVFICGLSGVTSLTHMPLGEILENPAAHRLMTESLDEVANVAQASGVEFAESPREAALGLMGRIEPSIRGSMYYDLVASKRLELAYLNGKVVDLGRKHDVPTPVNSIIVSALEPFADGA